MFLFIYYINDLNINLNWVLVDGETNVSVKVKHAQVNIIYPILTDTDTFKYL